MSLFDRAPCVLLRTIKIEAVEHVTPGGGLYAGHGDDIDKGLAWLCVDVPSRHEHEAAPLRRAVQYTFRPARLGAALGALRRSVVSPGPNESTGDEEGNCNEKPEPRWTSTVAADRGRAALPRGSPQASHFIM
jgi:hypothetical protein